MGWSAGDKLVFSCTMTDLSQIQRHGERKLPETQYVAMVWSAKIQTASLFTHHHHRNAARQSQTNGAVQAWKHIRSFAGMVLNAEYQIVVLSIQIERSE